MGGRDFDATKYEIDKILELMVLLYKVPSRYMSRACLL